MTGMTLDEAVKWLRAHVGDLRSAAQFLRESPWGAKLAANVAAMDRAADKGTLAIAALEAARADAERLAFLASEPVIEGFVGVEKDIDDYAFDAAEEAGRDEPNEADMLTGLRRLIDAAIDQARRKGEP